MTTTLEASTFFSQFEETNSFLESLEKYSVDNLRQVYVVHSPLGNNNFEYDYEESSIILIPDYKILFVNHNSDKDESFKDYVEDIIDDIDNISITYDFRKRIGRKRAWQKKFTEQIDINDFKTELLDYYKIENEQEKRDVNIIISLLIGSINAVEKIGEDTPSNILDRVKQKIILFDGDQTRFIFKPSLNDMVSIQGLAGTGKTELLLHKLKELYLENTNNRIALTCFSKVLSNSLKRRVPEFFTTMKVNEQIEWDERLWVMSSWGGAADPLSGLYSFICDNYDLPYYRYSYSTDFDFVCKSAVKSLKELVEIKPCFDYILVDESQDFPNSFFELCKMVVSKTVYTAGDIFQNITDTPPTMKSVTYLLNRCYRTDNRTLMFAHALGLGLFEKTALNWFQDDDWNLFGYNIDSKYISVKNQKTVYELSRTPLRRFDDVEDNINQCTKLIKCANQDCIDDIVEVITEIKAGNPTVQPDDIAIVYVTPTKDNYAQIDRLSVRINNIFSWPVVKGYDTKETKKGSVFITNKYNIKGLEFPFIICVANKGIKANPSSRNTLYMAMTRSFLSSYLLVHDTDEELIDVLEEGLELILDKNKLIIHEPEEVMDKQELIHILDEDYKSQYDIAEEIFNRLKIPSRQRRKLRELVKTHDENTVDKKQIEMIIIANKDLTV
ncbi:ATP-binding domain-containing protein [Carnobacterium maltaromaticum]|uniref:ATP-binding domain-containing protein n=1 Tax=Carnobacterium maltaromaticum TaxID=2751 RepID=UPI00295EA386|nr:ATP-binding domain-containing protein [Carnobacterium maltaromaticum]